MKNARPAHQDGRLILFLFRDLFRHLEADEEFCGIQSGDASSDNVIGAAISDIKGDSIHHLIGCWHGQGSPTREVVTIFELQIDVATVERDVTPTEGEQELVALALSLRCEIVIGCRRVAA